MAEEGEKIYTFGPGIYATPERWRARFNHTYVGFKNVQRYGDVRPLPEDYAAFRKTFPVEGRQMDGMLSQGKISGYSAGLGAVAGGGLAMRWVRAPPLIMLSSVVTALTSYVVASDAASWIYGTYKYDNNAVITAFLTYVRDHRREPQESGSDAITMSPTAGH